MNRIEWLESRRNGLGGSDIAAICGLSKWSTPRDIWLQKTNKVPVDDNMNDVQYWGTVMEPLIVKRFEEVTGLNRFEIFGDNIRVMENAETQQMSNAAQQVTLEEDAAGLGVTEQELIADAEQVV